ncbi:MAG: hypothetical protein HYX90_07885 [Chloroflexi bacterium]|nr:hypothetical protein [Chloroflexota bacterium]
MTELLLEGDPKLLARVDKELLEEFAARGLASQVTLKTRTVQAKVAPGEMGFGEQIREILVGISGVLGASKEALPKLAEGVATRLAQNSLDVDVQPTGRIRVRARVSGRQTNVAELADKFARILEAQASQS